MRFLLAVILTGTALAQSRIDFDRDVRPILSDNCFACHGPDEKTRAAGLRLDTRDGAFERPGVIVPGDARASRLLARVSAEKPAMRMPPAASGKTLSANQTAVLRRWIEEGAAWKSHWAFEKPTRAEPPQTSRPQWLRNSIDAFILARLDKEGLKPSPEAEKAALLRRVTLDLTGLPPAPAELREYLLDKSADAYEKRVDRLLATPQHAERLALSWLDLARYADTHGYHIDSHRDMWPWRDWVIRAFERNMPFDRFTIEQLAGDLLPDATRDQKIATGFHRNHMINYEGGAIAEEYQTEYVVDRVETTATVWMGLTMGCARCHDHKYDPVKQRDFYRMFAFFNTVAEKGLDGQKGNAEPFLQLSSDEQKSRRDDLIEEIEAREEKLAPKVIDPLIAEWERTAKLPPEPAAAGLAAHWELDGGFAESSGAYRRANLRKGTASFGKGMVGGAAELDGESVLDFGAANELDAARPFTLTAWIRMGGPSNITLLGRKNFELAYGTMIPAPGLRRMSEVHVRLAHEGRAIFLRTLDRFERGPWRHFAITCAGDGRLSLYLDGKLARTEQVSEPAPPELTAEGTLQSGSRRLGKPLKGSIDDLRIYTRVLTAGDVEQLAADAPVQSLLNSIAKRSKEETERLREYFLDRAAPAALRAAHTELKELRKNKEDLDRSIPTVMIMAEMEKPRTTHILARGDYRNKTEAVTAGVPSVLPPLPAGVDANRLGFARWLTDPSHPLTARVAVNRLWQLYFGAGLVKTAEDFGSQGERPSHPELLDWLASEFIGTGWNIRAMERLIVTSAAYRQSSKVTPALLEKDPENRWLARGSRLRLQSELVRDNALAIAGLLNTKVGGPSVSPYEPNGVWEDIAYGDVFTAQKYVQSAGADLYRRSMYTFWKRTAPPSSMAAFDAPDREKCVARRSVTNTPLQALVLLNDPAFVEASRAFAQRMLAAGKTSRQRLNAGFEIALARKPRAEELQILAALASRQTREYGKNSPLAERLLATGESAPDARFQPAELAAWTLVASTILNLDETITRE